MAEYPVHGSTDWDGALRAYIDAQDAVRDTGRRRVVGASPTAINKMFLHRRGDIVTLELQVTDVGSIGYPAYTLPPGFRTISSTSVTIPARGEDGNYGTVAIIENNEVGFDQQLLQGTDNFAIGVFTFQTADEWPSALPGTQITPPSVVSAATGAPLGLPTTGMRSWVGFDGDPDNPRVLPLDKAIMYVTVERVGNVVFVSENGGVGYVEEGSAVTAPAGSWPVGFRPAKIVSVALVNGRGFIRVEPDGAYQVYASVNGGGGLDDDVFPATSWVTHEAWPTDLRGTEVTPPSVIPLAPVAEVPDTGTRHVPYAAGGIDHFVRRVGNLVSFWTGDAAFALDAGDQRNMLALLKVGFRPTFPFLSSIGYPQGFKVYASVGSTGDVLIQNSDTEGIEDASLGMMTFPTDDPWPTTLPGASHVNP